jgi:hypothetical protein
MSAIANFDLFPTDELFDFVFSQTQFYSSNSTVLTINFEQAGYQTGNVIRNVKSFFIYMLALGLLLIVYQVSKRLQHKYKM